MDEPLVRISTGFLKGSTKQALNGNTFYSFEGIPYAQPPLGNLRFKAPVPAKSWQGVRDAKSQAPPNYALQFVMGKTETGEPKMDLELGGSEDSLYLNVFTPSLPHDKYDLKPVMVYIHGGAFTQGGTKMYGPQVLLSEGVILVTIAYRLGPLGFLSFDDPNLGIGNAGMKDMVLGLKWVKQNIKAFNGDPNNVTIIGESAGAAAVHLLVLSPTTSGLFRRAIIESGSAIATFARADPQNGVNMAKRMGCTATDNEEILKFLQDLPAEDLINFQTQHAMELPPASLRYFAPVVENSEAKNAFMTEEPINILKSGKYNHVPIITGFNSDEGELFNLLSFRDKNTPVAERSLVPSWFGLKPGRQEYSKLAKKIKEHYLKGGTTTTEKGLLTEEAKRLPAETIFIRPVLQSAKLHSKTCKEPIYIYKLSAVTKLAFLSKGLTKGVCHADGLGYQFILPDTPEVEPGSIEDITRKRISKLFTNFAKNGNPNPEDPCDLLPIEWEPIENGALKLLEIGEDLSMVDNPEAECMAFWDEITKTYEHTKFY